MLYKFNRAVVLSMVVAATAPIPSWGMDYDFVELVGANTAVPGAGVNFSNFRNASLEGDTVTFFGGGPGVLGHYAWKDGAVQRIADSNTAAPVSGGANFQSYALPASQGVGTDLAFAAIAGSNSALFSHVDGNLVKLRDTDDAIPSGTGNFTSFSFPSIDASERVVFRGTGSGGQSGIYSNHGGSSFTYFRVADETTRIPGGGISELFTGFSTAIKSGNNAIFSGLGQFRSGIYQKTLSGISSFNALVDTTTAIPSGSGNFTNFFFLAADGTDISFLGSGGGAFQGVYARVNGTLQRIADTNTALPQGGGNFQRFQQTSIDNDDVAFSTQDELAVITGIYTNSGGLLQKVLAVGDTVGGETVVFFDDLSNQMLSDGHIVFGAVLNDGDATRRALLVTITEHRWRSDTSGRWDDGANWPFHGLPRDVVRTFIQPDHAANILGPDGPATLLTLTIGAQVSGVASLDLQATSHITTGEATIESGGRLTGDGIFNAVGGIINQGTIDMGTTGSLQILGGTLNNTGMVRGNGTVENRLINNSVGEVRADSGHAMTFKGTNNLNRGDIRLFGGLAEFTQNLTNTPTGLIAGNGTLIVDGGLINDGVMHLSGLANIAGDVTNNNLIITAGGVTTFFDGLHNAEEVRTSEGATTAIFGALTGPGDFTGTGTVNPEGLISLGSSPARIEFEGGLMLGSSSTLIMEIAGLAAGEGYDHFDIAGHFHAGGVLEIVLLDGFRPHVGDTFDLFDFDTSDGGFSGIALPDIPGAMGFDASRLLSDGVITVVPEPGTVGWLAVSLGLVGWGRGRPRGRCGVRGDLV